MRSFTSLRSLAKARIAVEACKSACAFNRGKKPGSETVTVSVKLFLIKML